MQSSVPVVSVLWCQECIDHGIFANTDPFEIPRPLSSTKLTQSRTTDPADGIPKPLAYSQTPGVFGSNTDESEQSQSRIGKLKSSIDLKQRANNHDTQPGPLETPKSAPDAAGSGTSKVAASTPSNKNFEVISLDSDEEAPSRSSNKGSKHNAQTASSSAVPASPRAPKTQSRPQESQSVPKPKPSPAQQQEKLIVKKAASLPPSPARPQPNQPLPKPTHSNMPPPTGSHSTSSVRSSGTSTANPATGAFQSPRKHIGNASPRTVQLATVATQPKRVNPALVDDDSEEDDDNVNASTSSSEQPHASVKRPNTTLLKRPITSNAYFVKKSASASAPHGEFPPRSLPPSRTPSQTGDFSTSSASNGPPEAASAEGDTTDEEVLRVSDEAPRNVARIPSVLRSKKKSPLIDSSSDDSSYLPGEENSGYESEEQTSSEDSESRHDKIRRDTPLNRKKRQRSMESYHSDSGSDQRRRSNTQKPKETSSRDSSRSVQPSTHSTKSTKNISKRIHDTTESSGNDEDGNHEGMDLDDPAQLESTGSRIGSNGSTRPSHGSQKQGRSLHSSDSWRNSRTDPPADKIRTEHNVGSSSSRQTSLKRKLEPSHSPSTSKPRRSKRVEHSSDEGDWSPQSSDSLEAAAPRSAKRPKLSETNREERHLAIYLGGLKGTELKQEKDALAMVRFPSSLRVRIVDHLVEATHVVVHDTGMRTYTMMRAISKGKWLLRFMWFVKLLRHAQPPDEEQFEFPMWPGARQSRLHVQNHKGRSGLPLRDLHFDLRKLNAEERDLAADLITATGGYVDESSVHVYSIIVVPDDQFNPEAVGKRQRAPFSALIESISKWENCLTTTKS